MMLAYLKLIWADDKKLEEKRCEVINFFGKLIRAEELLSYWPFHENQKKPLVKSHLNQKGTNLLSDVFVKELLKVFNWQNIDNLSKQSDVYDSGESP